VLLVGLVILRSQIGATASARGRWSTRFFARVSGHAVAQTKDFIFRAAPVAESLEQMAGLGMALNDQDKLAPQLLAFLNANKGLTRVLYGDESGDHLAAVRMNDGQVHIERTHIVDGRTRLAEYEVKPDGTMSMVRRGQRQRL